MWTLPLHRHWENPGAAHVPDRTRGGLSMMPDVNKYIQEKLDEVRTPRGVEEQLVENSNDSCDNVGGGVEIDGEEENERALETRLSKLCSF